MKAVKESNFSLKHSHQYGKYSLQKKKTKTKTEMKHAYIYHFLGNSRESNKRKHYFCLLQWLLVTPEWSTKLHKEVLKSYIIW